MKFLLDLFSRTPIWAIRSEAVASALTALRNVEARGTWEAAKPSIVGPSTNKVAIIPVQGVLSKDGPSWYGSNYDTISKALEDATSNPDVKHIVLQVDSPGGEVTGLPETAALVASAAQKKPVTAMVEGMSASAAYLLSSQARDIVLTPSGEVGSVGVRMMHVDMSKMLEDAGYKVTELYSGDFKTEWSPFKPLSEEAQADMKPRLENVHAQFIQAVAEGRGHRATEDIKAKRFGEGRMFDAPVALSHGMVDRVMPSRDFFRSLIPAETAVSPTFPLMGKKHELETAKTKLS
jgi:capsid assembly protease